ncbi:MAG: HAD family hydrolase [Candidatus Fermentibacteria bacterium]|nr:HAD family hydrolase [Candidatus Fermentibacteria bacterium]
MIRAVIFDFDGTLADFVESDTAALKYIHGLTDSDCTAAEFTEASVEGITQFHELVVGGKIDPVLMFKYRLSYAFEKKGMIWEDRFTDIHRKLLLKETKAYSGTEDMLKNLVNRVKLGLITNASDSVLQRQRIEASGLGELFQEILIAGEVGLSKPDSEIFLLMSRTLDVLPEECLFVGDSVLYDITGAASAGMQTVLYGVNRSDSKVADYRAENIQELRILIEEMLLLQEKS